MKNKCLFLLFILIVFQTNGQESSSIDIQLENCENLLNKNQYATLILAAQKGILLSEKKPAALTKFYFYKGFGYEYTNNQYLKAIICYENSLKIAQKQNDIWQETLAIMRLNYMYFATQQLQKNKQILALAKKILNQNEIDVEIKSILLGTIGEYYLNYSEYENFISYKLKAIAYRKLEKKSSSNDNNIGVSYIQIADAYNEMKQYNKALEYCKEAIPYIVSSIEDQAYLKNAYIHAYTNLNFIDKAKKEYTALYQLNNKGVEINLNLSTANSLMANYYIKSNKIKASNYANKAIYFAIKSKDEEIILEAKTIKAKILFENNDFEKAIDLLNTTKNLAQFSKKNYMEVCKIISKSYAKMGRFEQAYHFQEKFSKINDSILIQSAKQNIANAEARFQNNNKEQKIKILDTQNQFNTLQLQAKEKQKWFYISGIGLLIIIGGLLFYQSRNRKKTNQKLQLLNTELDQANKIKTRFFGILNHDLRSPVANLIHFLHLQKENPELLDEATKTRMQNKTIAGAENLLASMEDILLWSKGQMVNFKPEPKSIAVNQLFDDTKKVFSGYQQIKIDYQNTQNISLFTDENYLKTIIRNLTSNSINAFSTTTKPHIIWKAWQEKNTNYLSITDNGPGASQEQFKALYDDKEVVGIKTGLGLHLIRDLAKTINCEIKVSSKINQGTTITLML